MARLKKGEPKPGIIRSCLSCGLERYIAPSQISDYSTNYRCMVCRVKERFFFLCKICSSKVLTQPAQIKYRNRSTCSKSCMFILRREKTLERRKVYTKHQLDRLARYSKEAKEWREAVFRRDDYTCKECSVRGTYLEADHIKPFAYFPELRYELSNGRTLCRPCHNKTKIGYKKMRELYYVKP